MPNTTKPTIDENHIKHLKKRYNIVGDNPQLQKALNDATKVAPTELTTLIYGESGVGKEMFSHIIHDYSPRGKQDKVKLIAVNCGAIPRGTLESELFGHVKGAFTGADKDHKGYFEEANNGTIFLDEIGELPLDVQVKLLRVLENGQITRVGNSTPIKINVRVVAATNVDLLKAVSEGRFRQDLYYRLNQFEIRIPPLRERKEDIPRLFKTFMIDTAKTYNLTPITLDDSAIEYIKNYSWPGNIRELKNFATRLVILEDSNAGKSISAKTLENHLPNHPQNTQPSVSGAFNFSNKETDSNTLFQLLLQLKSLKNELDELKANLHSAEIHSESLNNESYPVNFQWSQGGHNSTIVPHNGANTATDQESTDKGFADACEVDDETYNDNTDDELNLEKLERRAIEKALKKTGDNKREAAKLLGISERTLYRKTEK